MPRTKKDIASDAEPVKKVTKNKISTTEDELNFIKEEKHTIKKEGNYIEAKDELKLPNLDQFKFQKKPHIKIEFDKSSPEKQKGIGLWEPQNWREFLVNLRIMRANNDAPVDSMGCHMSMDENAPPKVIRYQSLISLMLSSQTKDQVTFAAMERLRAKGLTVDNVLAMSDEELGQLIYPVGFWKTKVKYIKKTTQTLKEQYDGDIPDSVDKLCKLTGVGPKMAHICMKVAWNKVTGIGVDTHVHRISNRIGWVKKHTSTPEDTRKALQAWLPFELWSEVNHLMVGFGQTICLPIGPNCAECLNKDICPSSGKGKKSPIKKSPKKIKEEILEVQDTLKIENIPKTSPRKRKVSPIKEIPSEQKNIANEYSETSETADTKKMPRKRNKTKSAETSLSSNFKDNKHESNQDCSNVPNISKTKSIRKSPRVVKTEAKMT